MGGALALLAFFFSGSSSPLGFFSLVFLQYRFAATQFLCFWTGVTAVAAVEKGDLFLWEVLNGFVVAVAKVHLFQFEICCHVSF